MWGCLLGLPKYFSAKGQGDEDKENGCSLSLKTTGVNDNITTQGHHTPLLLISQGEDHPVSKEVVLWRIHSVFEDQV